MIENYLLTYAPLGLWTAWLLYEKQKLLAKFQDTMEKNTEALKDVCRHIKNGK